MNKTKRVNKVKKAEGKMIKGVAFAMMDMPIDYQICFRINQITDHFGKRILNNILLKKPTESFCDVQLNNLYGTYGYNKVLAVYKELYLGDLEKVG